LAKGTLVTAIERNNVQIRGHGDTAMVFAHGFGCDQNMWRFLAPAFQDRYKTVVFDNTGAGKSDLKAYDYNKYESLEGYADDIIEIGSELGLRGAIFVGHSVSAMIGIIAANKAPGLFKALILVAPSPCYIDDGDYIGGFARSQIEELLESLDSNHLGWSANMAPLIMGNPERPELGEELTNSFCRTDPEIAKHFAKVTFLSDTRAILEHCQTPCLILQCSNDVIAPGVVGEYLEQHLRNSKLVVLEATGHCPNLSAPEETVAAINSYLS